MTTLRRLKQELRTRSQILASTCVLSLFFGNPAFADLACPSLSRDDPYLESLLNFDANDFCIGLVRGLVASGSCTSGIGQGTENWVIEVARDRRGYHNNYNVTIIGPSELLGGNFSSSFERYEIEVVTFIGLNCKAAYYAVVAKSMYHAGPFFRAKNQNDHNWNFFHLANVYALRDKIMNHVGRYAVEKMGRQ